MKVARLSVVRHGETVWNAERRLQGSLDSALTARGRRQARAVARRLSGLSPHALYASDSGRAVETAHFISEATLLEPVLDSGLRERNLGVFEGRTAPECIREHAAAWRSFKAQDPDFVIPGGESVRQLYQRAVTTLETIAQRHLGEHVVVVTHGGTLKQLLRACVSLSLEVRRNFTTRNASLNVAEYEAGRFELLTWGDVAHLDESDIADFP